MSAHTARPRAPVAVPVDTLTRMSPPTRACAECRCQLADDAVLVRREPGGPAHCSLSCAERAHERAQLSVAAVEFALASALDAAGLPCAAWCARRGDTAAADAMRREVGEARPALLAAVDAWANGDVEDAMRLLAEGAAP